MSLLNPMDDDQLDQIIEGLDRIKELKAEVARLRLTDAEREAVETALYLCEATAGLADEQGNATAWAATAATLRGLLERTGGGDA